MNENMAYKISVVTGAQWLSCAIVTTIKSFAAVRVHFDTPVNSGNPGTCRKQHGAPFPGRRALLLSGAGWIQWSWLWPPGSGCLNQYLTLRPTWTTRLLYPGAKTARIAASNLGKREHGAP
jgi:hypothetical protein